MSDEIECPECGGTGEERLGPLQLMCMFCHGRKVVSGEHEPADDGSRGPGWPGEAEEHDARVHGPLPPVWEHPAVRGSGLCTHCLGAGVVVSEGSYAEAPCPVCSGGGR
ncbi:hypothetical protein ETD83_33380 [Actinomadura soli]|uniref:Chaperone protein DnaJ n=1 Tax=Actinomadura soli TaxID=2508997 RepID=A0A5C4J2C0_9ACTN|nr:hypothetical protein [Actinomadura soli]TMQ90895.1 hypothetical protein ETD83_33380 [Actinomadura soli]